MSKSKIGLVSVGVPWFDVELAQAFLGATRAALAERFEVVGPPSVVTNEPELAEALAAMQAAGVKAAVFQLGTFPDGNTPAQAAETLGVPIVLSGFPEPLDGGRVPNNSLCGLNMATYTLTELGHPHSYAFCDPGTEAGARKLVGHVVAAVTLSELRGSVVGLLGYRAPGFYPATFDELLLRRTFGVRVEHVGIQEVTHRVRDGSFRQPPVSRFPTIEGGELGADAVEWLGRYYGALYEAVSAHAISAWAVKDWPEMAPFDPDIPAGIWPALSWLQDDGYNVAPEGDVNGAVTLELLARLSGNQPFFADISGFDAERSTLELWHYGGGTKVARSQDEIRFGADGRELEFCLKPGPGVLVRLGYSKGAYRLLLIDVEVLDERVTLRRAGGRVVTRRTNAADVVDAMLGGGWEHHVSFVHGEVSEEVRAFAKVAGLDLTWL